MTGLNYPMSTVVMATTLTTVGGIAAAFITGPSMDRLGAYKTLGILYLVGFVCVALTGLAFKSPLWMLLIANFLAGCCISGGQKASSPWRRFSTRRRYVRPESVGHRTDRRDYWPHRGRRSLGYGLVTLGSFLCHGRADVDRRVTRPVSRSTIRRQHALKHERYYSTTSMKAHQGMNKDLRPLKTTHSLFNANAEHFFPKHRNV